MKLRSGRLIVCKDRTKDVERSTAKVNKIQFHKNQTHNRAMNATNLSEQKTSSTFVEVGNFFSGSKLSLENHIDE